MNKPAEQFKKAVSWRKRLKKRKEVSNGIYMGKVRNLEYFISRLLREQRDEIVKELVTKERNRAVGIYSTLQSRIIKAARLINITI